MIRAFIALTLPVTLQQAIQEVSVAFQRLPLHLRWVNTAHVHLTLKFLGNIPAQEIATMSYALERALAGQAPFTLSARSVGGFPNFARPRVLWMGIDDPGQVLARVHQRLEVELASCGLAPDERPFRPHVTLARVPQGRRGGQLMPLLRAYQDRVFGEIVVTHIHLFQSQLHREGAVYTILHSVALQNH